ncbi:katanin p80 WD40 repeat-containing subunit B1 homolog KTN80.4-like isoform X2 [Lotus japonicus]|nr:katanin p80 WD40 repeat-containing subunit B1 homolog KTN80.4-like isoform X2 [Lotus japonicus]
MDTNLKIWDIRKKGCIHTYKGHSQGISTIKFTPDGRWVVSGGFDNVVKVWDLTAGKLLHDFKFHEGHISSLDFHPLEFLLATGSADRTVKFWDLESFELIGSARREATGVRSIAFHPDGRTLFTGHEDGLKVYSWEPVICHDAVDMGWTTLGDLCIHDGKLLGCSFYRNSVGVWVADISLIEPYGDGFDPKNKGDTEQILSKGSKLEKVEADVGPTSGLRSMSPDESKEIKNIYIDSSGGKPVAFQRSGSLNSLRVDLPEESKKICNLGTVKQSSAAGVHVKSNEQTIRKSFIVSNIVPREIPDDKDPKSEKETITFAKTKPGMLLRPAHVRRASTGRFDVDRFSDDVNSENFCDTASKLDSAKDSKFQINLGSQNEVKECCEDKHPIKSITDKLDKTLSPYKFSTKEKRDGSSSCNEEISPVKYVNGVAVVRGRTRSLVERFERKEKIQISEDPTNSSLPSINEAREVILNEDQINASPTVVFEKRERRERIQTSEDQSKASLPTRNDARERIHDEVLINASSTVVFEKRERIPRNEDRNNIPPIPNTMSETGKSPSSTVVFEKRERIPRNEDRNNIPPIPNTMSETGKSPSSTAVFEKRERIPRNEDRNNIPPIPNTMSETGKSPSSTVVFEKRERMPRNEDRKNIPPIPNTMSETGKSPSSTVVFEKRERIPRNEDRNNIPPIPNTMSETGKSASSTVVFEKRERIPRNEDRNNILPIPNTMSETDKSPSIPKAEPQISKVDSNSDVEIIESLMQTHDATLSNLRSRLTKLQVVRHFWERNDIKGAINALRKLPDQSVQADVISVLVEKMEILSLDLFSCLFPVLTGLLDSRTERHVKVSLDLLLKLVAVFGPTIRATVSAPPSVGVDLHQEQRRECCNQCFMQLQKTQMVLPILIRRGGLLAKSALELNLVLQQS